MKMHKVFKNKAQGCSTPLKVLTMISYFKYHFFPHLLIFLQFRDPSYVLNLSIKAVQQKWHIQSKRAKYLQFELIFRRA